MQIIESQPIKRVLIQWGSIEWCAEIHADREYDLPQALAQAEIISRAERAEADAAQWKRVQAQIAERLSEIKSDERLSYPPANVVINAPLALIQVDLEARVVTLEWVLSIIDKKAQP